METKKTPTLPEKLLEMQKRVDKIVKDGKNLSDKYDFASDENVLDKFRPLMDEYGLLLIPRVVSANLHEGATRTGTARFFTELNLEMVWYDTQSLETLVTPWYAQGVDLAGEKGVGKALTYAEKYFLLKFFHVSTTKDDPDNDKRGSSGEKKQRGTQAEKEKLDYMRRAVPQMLTELSDGDAEKIKAGYVALTKSDSRGYAGVDNLNAISDAALPVVYAKLKKQYVARTGHEPELKEKELGD